MEVSDNRTVLFGSIALLLVVFIGGIYWMNTGHGEVSKSTYEFAKALAGCQDFDKQDAFLNPANSDSKFQFPLNQDTRFPKLNRFAEVNLPHVETEICSRFVQLLF